MTENKQAKTNDSGLMAIEALRVMRYDLMQAKSNLQLAAGLAKGYRAGVALWEGKEAEFSAKCVMLEAAILDAESKFVRLE